MEGDIKKSKCKHSGSGVGYRYESPICIFEKQFSDHGPFIQLNKVIVDGRMKYYYGIQVTGWWVLPMLILSKTEILFIYIFVRFLSFIFQNESVYMAC